MSSQDINGLNTPLVFQEETLRFNCGPPQRRVGISDPKTRELSGFMDEKLFAVHRDRFFASPGTDFRRNVFGEGPDRSESRNWNGNGSNSTPRCKGSEEDEEDEDEDEEDDDDDGDDDEVDDKGEGDVERLVAVDEGNKSSHDGNNHCGSSVQSGGANKIGNGKAKHHSSFGGIVMVGSNREVLMKDDVAGLSGNHTGTSPSSDPTENNQPRRLGGSYSNAVTIAENDGDVYYSQYLQGNEGSASRQKELVLENGCGFSGRRDVSYSCESGESLRAILSDPVTGALMDDAVILSCGHSFGSGGIQHVLRTKVCYTCYQSISGDSIALNLSLRAAVEAFRREEELQLYRSPKRRKERFDQDKGGFGDSIILDARGRGVQFPFAVTDRVIIKGNKRTPQRFVGREAVVTTQCLNGWYVVKTVDNAESVKLQYRSLSKVPNDPSSKPMSNKTAPNWL